MASLSTHAFHQDKTNYNPTLARECYQPTTVQPDQACSPRLATNMAESPS